MNADTKEVSLEEECSQGWYLPCELDPTFTSSNGEELIAEV